MTELNVSSTTAKIRAELLRHRVTSEQTFVTKHHQPGSDQVPTWKPMVLVISGGGAKGFALPGALFVLQQTGMLSNIVTVAGTSIGGLFGALLVCGFSATELAQEACTTQFGPVSEFSLGRFALFNSFNGDDWLRAWIERLVASKLGADAIGITLSELHSLTHKELVLCTVRVDDAQIVYLSAATHPELPLVTAILMSCSIPFVFPPVSYGGHDYIDGGVQDNYMLGRFDPAVTLGIRLSLRDRDMQIAGSVTRDEAVSSSESQVPIISRLSRTVATLVRSISVTDRLKEFVFASAVEFERTSLYPEQYEIQVSTENVDSSSFDICVERRRDLLQEGARAAALFVDNPRPTSTGCVFRRGRSL